MRILVVGLEGAVSELLFGDECLVNIRRLMDAGCHGRLESANPPLAVPAWMCFATGQDPGSLGVYGSRNRADHSYDHPRLADWRSIDEPTIWDQVAREGGKSVIIGVPPGYPPLAVDGIFVGCLMAPDTGPGDYTHPAEAARRIEQLVGSYSVELSDFRTRDKDRLRSELEAMSRKQFTVARYFLEHEPWHYFQVVDSGLAHVQHAFWKYHDSRHVLHEPDSPYRHVIRDYYRYLDDELGSLLELLDAETIVLVVSDRGTQSLNGAFHVNEWLVREGLLVVDHDSERARDWHGIAVDWSKTRVWSDGGAWAPVYFNVKGREPEGTIARADYEPFRDEIKARLEAITDAEGRPLGTRVFKPEEIYRTVRNVAPDLIVHFGGLSWRSNGAVGSPALHVTPGSAGLGECTVATGGVFVLAAPHAPTLGPVEGASLLDMAPTLLALGGYDRPPAMQGRSLVTGDSSKPAIDSDADEMMVRDRLRGLGYIG